MIAVDTSALMAIVLDEPQAETCMVAIEAADGLLISAGTVAEALIVAGRRNVGEEIAALVEGLGSRWSPSLKPRHAGSPKPMPAGARAFIPPDSTTGIASPMRSPANAAARCSSSATTSHGRTCCRFCEAAQKGFSRSAFHQL